ncbi:hypothetical protein ACOQFV_11285 [Nocardiopsis changdeensis]|uniref:DUF2007 domain-containing protein n=1 Tax=Nocardiopsis changdeensis TaxID=2831969 RepID=A0ABX8BTR9_9ACTN|nr:MULTISPECIES: hypothetical protein [Nocardiopsis]QUX24487.1 hypothetical protein KGD84_09540 [Nocardiopsis changdeensis]QYX34879.1 hypothetical protein K1J57_19000 [Nocardiopsis sp. MT53]
MTQRRGNGLLADAYVPLILLAPTHADLMLEALRRSGIAAYAVPLAEDVLEPPGGDGDDPPTDHLYVDAEERVAAERVLGTELPELGVRAVPEAEERREEADADDQEAAVGGDLLDGPPGNVDPDAPPARSADEDAVWNDLVARFYDDDAPSSRGARWPDAENAGPPAPRGRTETPTPGDILAGDPDDEDDDEEALRRAEDELEGHYEPPPPPPLLQGDRLGIAAWFGLLGGPVLVFGAAFLGLTLPNWLMFMAVVAFLAGFVILILRMTDGRPPGDNGPDNGAVV